MREYELTYLVSDEVLENDLNKVTGKVSEIISDAQGKVQKEEIWGRRKLSYPIKKQHFANYITLWVELPEEKVAEVSRELQVMPQVIRHLLIVKAAGSEKISVTKEDVVAEEELEEIIGDKSVEIIEGETDKSYDLMAVRETDEEDEIEQKTATTQPDTTKTQEPIAETETETKSTKTPEQAVKKEIKKQKVGRVARDKTTEKQKSTTKADSPAKEKAIKADSQKPTQKTDKQAEADRIKKLDEKLDELLGDDI